MPRRCPYDACPSRTAGPFLFQRAGSYKRRCDGRRVPRFLCLRCRRTFSSQTFRLDYRLRRSDLWTELFEGFVSKITMRQLSRIHRCSRKTVAARLRLFGRHCRAFQDRMLEQARTRGGLGGRFQLDELKTFEHNRRLCPLSVPVLIERKSYFVLSAEAVPLPARGGLSPHWREKKLARDAELGVRRSGSRAAVARAFELLERTAPPAGPVVVETDEKHTYASELKRRFGERVVHHRHSSTEPRVYGSALFPINHTLAMMRDGISRLVRRTWAASKKAVFLELHQWIWIVWRNFVRSITNASPDVTPAMALELVADRYAVPQILALREPG